MTAGQPARRRGRRLGRPRRWLAREIAFVALPGAGLGAAGWGLIAVASYRIPLGFCLAVGLAVAASWRLVAAVRLEPEPSAPGQDNPEPETGGFPELYLLEHRLSWGSVDPERFELRVRPQLVRLTEERLRQRHGVDPWREPDRARGIVGEPLWLLMTGPPTQRAPSPGQVADLVSQLERI
jgi:hypothetical protein